MINSEIMYHSKIWSSNNKSTPVLCFTVQILVSFFFFFLFLLKLYIYLAVAANAIITELGRLRQEDHPKFEASLHYVTRPCFQNKNKDHTESVSSLFRIEQTVPLYTVEGGMAQRQVTAAWEILEQCSLYSV